MCVGLFQQLLWNIHVNFSPALRGSPSPELGPQAFASLQRMLSSGTLEEDENLAIKKGTNASLHVAKATLQASR